MYHTLFVNSCKRASLSRTYQTEMCMTCLQQHKKPQNANCNCSRHVNHLMCFPVLKKNNHVTITWVRVQHREKDRLYVLVIMDSFIWTKNLNMKQKKKHPKNRLSKQLKINTWLYLYRNMHHLQTTYSLRTARRYIYITYRLNQKE